MVRVYSLLSELLEPLELFPSVFAGASGSTLLGMDTSSADGTSLPPEGFFPPLFSVLSEWELLASFVLAFARVVRLPLPDF